MTQGLGWSGGVLGAENDFYDVVEAVCSASVYRHNALLIKFKHVDKPLRVYVYSYDFEWVLDPLLFDWWR